MWNEWTSDANRHRTSGFTSDAHKIDRPSFCGQRSLAASSRLVALSSSFHSPYLLYGNLTCVVCLLLVVRGVWVELQVHVTQESSLHRWRAFSCEDAPPLAPSLQRSSRRAMSDGLLAPVCCVRLHDLDRAPALCISFDRCLSKQFALEAPLLRNELSCCWHAL